MAYDKRGELFQKSLQRHLDEWKARLEEIEENPLHHPKPKSVKGLRFDKTALPTDLAIEGEKLTKAFGGKGGFSRFDIRLCKGHRIVLTGPNGSGKTTLLRCLAER